MTLNVISCPGWDPGTGTEKGHRGRTGKIRIKCQVQFIVIINVGFLVVTNVP